MENKRKNDEEDAIDFLKKIKLYNEIDYIEELVQQGDEYKIIISNLIEKIKEQQFIITNLIEQIEEKKNIIANISIISNKKDEKYNLYT